MPGKLRPQLLGDVGHGCEVGGAADIDPAPELAHAHAALPLRYAERGEMLPERSAREPGKRFLRRQGAQEGRGIVAYGRRHGHRLPLIS